jgi:hypothetical protein
LLEEQASFLAARTAYPLSEHFGPRAPFYVSTALAAFSVFVNLIYISLSRRLVELAGAELEAADISSDADAIPQTLLRVKLWRRWRRRNVKFICTKLSGLGDVFWAYVHSQELKPRFLTTKLSYSYIALNVFCGFIWTPFTQLSA